VVGLGLRRSPSLIGLGLGLGLRSPTRIGLWFGLGLRSPTLGIGLFGLWARKSDFGKVRGRRIGLLFGLGLRALPWMHGEPSGCIIVECARFSRQRFGDRSAPRRRHTPRRRQHRSGPAGAHGSAGYSQKVLV
jgi:hypothetical protein